MHTTLDIDRHWSKRPARATPATRHTVSLLVAAAVLLPLTAVILMSQRLDDADASLVLSGITGFVMPSHCRAALEANRSSHVSFNREQIVAALRKPARTTP